MGRDLIPGLRRLRCGERRPRYLTAPGWRRGTAIDDALGSSTLLQLFLLGCLCTGTGGFEVFTEQQIVTLNEPNPYIDFNNTEYGSTYVDDYWNKIDINFSPLEGWSLFKHVRIGCFLVRWDLAEDSSFIDKVDAEMTDMECVQYCNRTQAYFKMPECRCALNEDDLYMTEEATCTEDSWEVFREYDYRSSMSPSTYDVARRLVYQIVTLRVPHVADSIRYYIHAVNAMESKPKFEYDTPLDRMVFNAIWDFGKSRMVALSFEDFGRPLDFTIIHFNSSTGALQVTQEHYPIQEQITAEGSLLGEGLASCDGLSTIDILYGTYYTVVPALLPDYPGQVVHVIVAIDIETKKVLYSVTQQLTLMNMQVNALHHVLYGAGVYINGKYAYYKLCEAGNTTEVAGDTVRVVIRVDCDCETCGEMNALPTEVQYMYLQSAAIDHKYDYAWFAYKTEATGPPLLLEYHHDDAADPYTLWKEETFGMDTAYASIIQTAPRIIFALYPPTIKYAKFNSAGTKIFIQFDSPTLRGAIPIDSDGDEVPDYFNIEDKVTRTPCERFMDDFTMKLIPNSMCQWTSETDIFIEVTLQSTIQPGDLVRIRPGSVFAGKRSLSGIYQFSQPSTDFGVVQLPDFIPTPVVSISGPEYIDTCTELFLDGAPSTGHGFRGTFLWSLNKTNPYTSEPHTKSVDKIISGQNNDYNQAVTIPSKEMMAAHEYFFQLTVVSFFDEALRTTRLKRVKISDMLVPPLVVYGADTRNIQYKDDVSLTSFVALAGSCLPDEAATVEYKWTGCKVDQLERSSLDIDGCPQDPPWDPDTFTLPGPLAVSGIDSRSLLIKSGVLELFGDYVFTIYVTVIYEGQNMPLRNQASVRVSIGLSELYVDFTGGNGFSTPRSEIITVDNTIAIDTSDPESEYGGFIFNYSCEMGTERRQCPFLTEGRRLQKDEPVYFEPPVMPYFPCVDILDGDGNPTTFSFRGRIYRHAEGITNSDAALLNPNQTYCMSEPGILIFQRQIMEVGLYKINVNMSKITRGELRMARGAIDIEVTEETIGDRSTPLINITTQNDRFCVEDVIRFTGHVTNEKNDTTYLYSWSAFKWSANPLYDADLAQTTIGYNVATMTWIAVESNEVDFSDYADIRTPIGSRFLVTTPRLLSPNVLYKFRLTVYDEVLQARGAAATYGYADLAFLTEGLPPSGGRLETSNLTGEAFVTSFRFTLLGWGTEDLPLQYKFGYKQDPDDDLMDVSYLSAMYTDQAILDTILPPGLGYPSNRIQVLGYARSNLGAVTNASLELSVREPPPDAYYQLIETAKNMEPETALVFAIMAAQAQAPNNTDALERLLDIVENKTLVRNITVPLRGNTIAMTDQVVTQIATFLAEVAAKGLKTRRVIDDIGKLLNASIALGFLSAEDTFRAGGVNVAKSLLSIVDSFIPGDDDSVYQELTAAPTPSPTVFVVIGDGDDESLDYYDYYATPSPPRRLGTGIYMPRALQAVVTDTRSENEQYLQFEILRGFERDVAHVLSEQLVPGEVPATFLMHGHDYYVGKALAKVQEEGYGDEVREFSPITMTFNLPSMGDPLIADVAPTFCFLYTQWKRYPFTFIPLPEGKAIGIPNISTGPTAKKIPDQRYELALSRLWHAMSLELTTPEGVSLDDLFSQTLENASFSMLPKLAAHHIDTPWTSQYAATCYKVVHGENASGTYYEPKGVVYEEASCITTTLSDYVVLIDDLSKDLSLLEEVADIPTCLQTAFVDCPIDFVTPVQEVKTGAMASSLVLGTILTFVVAGLGWFLDFQDEDKREKAKKRPNDPKAIELLQPIDSAHQARIYHDEPDPKEKFIKALIYAFKRNHLVVGFGSYHRRLSREKRVAIWYLAWLATHAITTVIHSSRVNFRAQDVFVAAGVIAGILCFPIVQGAMFLFEWRPDTLVKRAPPVSNPPKPIPLQQQVQMPRLHEPKRPLIPTIVRPPSFMAPPRVALPAHLALPVVKPGPPNDARSRGPGGQIRRPPPKRPPGGSLKPMPPPGPPPANHLMARGVPALPGPPPLPSLQDAAGASPSTALVPSSTALVPPSYEPPGQITLKVPELPKLSLQSAISAFSAADKEVPKPPPRPPSDGPKPPRQPPPMTKMFTVPKTALRVPPMPPLKGGQATSTLGLPELPNLPKLMRPAALSQVKLAGDSGVPGPPPPPPPSKGRPGQAPIAPRSPREADFSIPGTLLGSELGVADTDRSAPQAPPTEDGSREQSQRSRFSPPSPNSTFRSVVSPKSAPEDVESRSFRGQRFNENPEHTMAPPPPPPPPKGQPFFRDPAAQAAQVPKAPSRPPPPGTPIFQLGDLPDLPELPQGRGPLQMNPPSRVPPSGALQLQPSAPPSMPPPPRGSGHGDTIPPLLLTSATGGPPKRAPTLPTLPLPGGAMRAKVSSIQPHSSLIPPPPPPPPLTIAAVATPEPPPPEYEEKLDMFGRRVQKSPPAYAGKLQPFKGESSLARLQPKPPAKKAGLMLPTPPSAPPPAHAIVLARKPEIGNKDTPPTYISDGRKVPKTGLILGEVQVPKAPNAVVKPPSLADLPSFVHKSVPTVPKAPNAVEENAKRILDLQSWKPAHAPIKDWVVQATGFTAYFVMLILMGNCIVFILVFGTGMDSMTSWFTHAATFVGLLANLGLFESIKCVVLACLALVKDETVHRSNEVAARRARMALKAQRLKSEGRWARSR